MNFDELTKMQETYLNEIKTNGQKLVHQAFKEFFEANLLAHSIKWRQYTPYFNDGDVCEFGVHDFEIKLNGIDSEEGGDYSDGYFGKYELNRLSTDQYFDKNLESISHHDRKQLSDNLIKFRSVFNHHSDLMRMVFGDHVVITANKDSFEVEEYEHE